MVISSFIKHLSFFDVLFVCVCVWGGGGGREAHQRFSALENAKAVQTTNKQELLVPLWLVSSPDFIRRVYLPDPSFPVHDTESELHGVGFGSGTETTLWCAQLVWLCHCYLTCASLLSFQPYDNVIHIVLIAIWCVPLITGFQPHVA